MKKWQTREGLGVLLLSLGLVSWAPSIHQLEQEKYRHISVVQHNPQTFDLGRSEDVLPAHERYDKSVFVYLPYWSEDFVVPWQKITHLAYFSLEIDANGDITDSHGWANGLDADFSGSALVEAGHAAGVKIVLNKILII